MKLLLTGITTLLFFISFSQSYTNDREKFVKEFQKALSEYGRGEFHEFSKKELPQLLLETSDFSDKYFLKMVETCNLMESKKIKPYPSIYNYVFSVSAFVKNNQTEENYIAWHSSVDKLLKSRNVKKIKDFLEMSEGLFSESRIATSSNFRWYYIGGEYEFIFDKKVFIRFKKGNLVCRIHSKKSKDKGAVIDSLVVINTEGIYDPILKKWEGENGTITWEKVGLNPTETFAKINHYNVSLKASTIRIDSVLLTSPYFKEEIQGSLNDRAFKINRETDRIYPQFLSFDRKLLIKDIVENIDYIGGFSLHGASFIGAGTNSEMARITYKRKSIPFIVAKSPQIYITKDKVKIKKAQVTLFLSLDDSLTHAGLDFSYDLLKKKIELTRYGNGIGSSPFIDSYHQMEIYVPKIIWSEGTENLFFTFEFGTSQEQKNARFESDLFFDEEVYDRLQGLAKVHPLVAIYNYCYKYDEFKLTEGKVATALGLTITQAKPTILNLSKMGFINYDSDNKTVTVNKKLVTFVKAKSGKIDYDNMVFRSDLRPKKLTGYTSEQIKKDKYLQSISKTYTKQNEERRVMKNFAIMSLETFDLDILAIDHIIISKKNNTMVFPSNSEVKVKKNRDFNFSGWINAGKLEVNTIAAKFNYNDYKFTLIKTDKAIFRVRPMRQQDGPKPIAMQSSLTGITGEILIDSPTNRSGKSKEFSDFPKLNVNNKSKVFYNSKQIYRGAYDSTRFYYTVIPFTRDSLNSFEEKTFRLKGELVSAGIFPKINKSLKIMPDYSFGFSSITPEGGLNFYGPKAKYENKIILSNNGLQGSGVIQFVHSTSTSKILTFLPDSTIGIATFVNQPIENGIQFPDVTGENIAITYIPVDKILKVRSTPQNDLSFFKGEAKLRGEAIVKPSGMTGRGFMTFVSATLVSDQFNYKRYDIYADTASFNLRNESEDVSENALAFKTDNVKSHISFKDRMGKFNSNQGVSIVEFPVNQYMCKMDQFSWLMDDSSIEMQKKEERDIAVNTGVDLVGPNFFSTHPKQDSLQFSAPKAKFDLKEKVIYCDKVEYIDIADARIYPDSMKVKIRKKAKLDKLIHSRIVANYITKYHSFEDAGVEILARRKYSAKGNYPYYDKDSTVTYVEMNNIGLDTSYQTIASGVVTPEMNFKLSPEFEYYGGVAIKASNPLISFNGATRIIHSCDKFDRNWMAFDSEIDPNNIQIPVTSSMKDLDGNALSAGIVWRDSPSTDSIQLYPTFLSSLIDDKDPIVMTSEGFLQYDYGSNQFEISSKDKLINLDEKGNYLALHTESCSMNGVGKIDLGMDFGDVTVESVGTVNYHQKTGRTSMNLTMRLNMAIDKGILQDVAERINEVEGLKPMSFSSTTLEQAIVEWDGQEIVDKFKDEYIRLGEVKKLPKSLQQTMTYSGIRLSSYDSNKSQTKGLITDVNSAILVSMYNKPVMKYVPFQAFFQQIYSKAGGDRFTLFMNIPGGRDYFFNYTMQKKDGLMRIKTGDEELKSNLNELKEEKRKKKNFKYELTNSTVFLAKFLELFQ